MRIRVGTRPISGLCTLWFTRSLLGRGSHRGKGRRTQLSIVGSRVIHLCEECDAATIAYYLRTRPNPLMPDQLPNSPGEEG